MRRSFAGSFPGVRTDPRWRPRRGPMQDSDATTSKILVVDDNEANRSLARSTLEDEGYRVVLANGGAEGIAAFEAERPDCVLLDVRMPGVDGYAVCERIRALGSATPVLFLTSLRDVDDFERALRAGADDFLTKPVRPSELVVRVRTALNLRRLERNSQLLDTAPDAMVVVGEDGRIHLVNVQTEKLFGYTRSELLGQPLELLIPERFRGPTPGTWPASSRIPARARWVRGSSSSLVARTAPSSRSR